ncbi:DUF6457 domain-containing protein [Propionibacteriaceae bacterium Y1685]
MTLDEWTDLVADELGLSGIDLDADNIHIVLDLARDAAHQVQRPAAPLTTFLVGLAVGRGEHTLGSAAARATALAMSLDESEAAPPADAPSTDAEKPGTSDAE